MARFETLTSVVLPVTSLPLSVRLPGGSVSPVAGSTTSPAGATGSTNGFGASARFNFPGYCAVAPNGLKAYQCDVLSHMIRVIDLVTFEVTTLAGSGAAGDADGVGAAAILNRPWGITISPDGLYGYFTDRNNFKIKRVTLADGNVVTLAGTGSPGAVDGTGVAASFHNLAALVLNAAGTILFIADLGNNKLRQMVVSSAVVSTLAGSGAAGTRDDVGAAALFNGPDGLAIDPTGTWLFNTDFNSHVLRRTTISTGQVVTVAGTATVAGTSDGIGQGAQFNNPAGLAFDPSGGALYIATRGGHRVRRFNPKTGRVTTLAGSGVAGYANGDGTAAQFNGPHGIAWIPGRIALLVGEFAGHRVRMIT